MRCPQWGRVWTLDISYLSGGMPAEAARSALDGGGAAPRSEARAAYFTRSTLRSGRIPAGLQLGAHLQTLWLAHALGKEGLLS